MARRLQLHEELCDILGSRNVYFQPPESMKIKYPAIIYRIVDRDDLRADDRRYRGLDTYELLHITRDPDSDTPYKILERIQYSSSERPYTKDNLHHNPIIIHY